MVLKNKLVLWEAQAKMPKLMAKASRKLECGIYGIFNYMETSTEYAVRPVRQSIRVPKNI
jgi:hypothetical protein